ncbi:MAG: hypothetical protein ACRCWI_00125 [Brevinema sp.]
MIQKEQVYASFIFYYDEKTELDRYLFNQLESWITSYFEYFELILVNNSSLDSNILQTQLEPTLKDVMLIDLGGKHIQDQALRSGIEFSKGDSVFIIIDYTISNIIEQLESLYNYHKDGNDIIILNSNYTTFKYKALLTLTSKFLHKEISLKHNSIFVLSKRVINFCSLTKSRILPLSILLKDSGYNIKQISYTPTKNVPLSKDDYTVYMMIFSDLLPQLAFYISIVCLLGSLVGIVYVLLVFIFKQNIVEGWTTLFLLCSFGFSGIFIILSFLTRYLGLLGQELLGTSMYKTKQIKKL